MTALYENTVDVLSTWAATSDDAESARKRTLDLLADGPIAMTRAHRSGHVTASALIVGDDSRVLLCLHGRLGLPVALIDERLSSFEARGELLRAGPERRGKPAVDALAAVIILETWLSSRSTPA